MKRHSAIAAAVLLAVVSPACGGDEQAGEEQPAPAAQERQQDAPDVSDEELRAFAEATAELQDIAEEARSDIQQAEGEQAAQQIRQDFHAERARIVEAAGLDTARYTEIRQAVQSNAGLQQRYLEFQQEVQP